MRPLPEEMTPAQRVEESFRSLPNRASRRGVLRQLRRLATSTEARPNPTRFAYLDRLAEKESLQRLMEEKARRGAETETPEAPPSMPTGAREAGGAWLASQEEPAMGDWMTLAGENELREIAAGLDREAAVENDALLREVLDPVTGPEHTETPIQDLLNRAWDSQMREIAAGMDREEYLRQKAAA